MIMTLYTTRTNKEASSIPNLFGVDTRSPLLCQKGIRVVVDYPTRPNVNIEGTLETCLDAD
jgi:hypothetical protein